MSSVKLNKMIEKLQLVNLVPEVSTDEIEISSPEINRPALQLAGYFEHFASERVQIIGYVEYTYLKSLDRDVKMANYEQFLSSDIPCVIYSTRTEPDEDMIELAKKYHKPLLSSHRITSDLMAEVIRWLGVELAPCISIHGVLMDVYGEGILIMGESGIGKSEAALELIKRGHRLVSDDVVEIRAGEQIAADAVVLDGTAQANESLLTGEARPIAKNPGDGLRSGSFLAAGHCVARLTKVGAESYAAKLATEAKADGHKVVKGEMSYNYDLPGDGTPIIVPINMGDGPYTFRVMQNTSGNNYVELFSVIENVNLSSETAPFLVPNMFVNYNESSAVVAKARELAQGAANQGDVVRNIYQWVVDNITYDHDKAAQLASATGYVPDPDATLASGTGICFDYASLGAAMLRSLGIPCQVITGYVSPDDVYHAWNMVYIDGEWISVEISIKPNSWTRVDLTFAASGAASTIGDGTSYTDRYTY